ncbi:hypothetical protein N431DRAFT_495819 [Stipitochalara longipes BDJ]|nr:hypothetical protein N431DRAFT_495819 [Stipitochalara longipes BDJ]
MSSERPAKRVRQACEPCRRKKSRCPGEKPNCSHCTRLRQNCYYADERHERVAASTSPTPQPRSVPSRTDGGLEDRLMFVEAQLAEVLANQASLSNNASRQVSASPGDALHQFRPRPISRPSDSHPALPPWDVIFRTGENYLLYCDCQPLPLFDRSIFMQKLKEREPEVLFSLLGLALRFDEDGPNHEGQAKLVKEYVEAARAFVTKKVMEGLVELSTIQSLCLLSLIDFSEGFTRRASVQTSLAMSLVHNAGMTSETSLPISDHEKEERRRCFWSLFLLKKLHGADFTVLDFAAEDNYPWYPATPCDPLNLGQSNEPSNVDVTSGETGSDRGIMAYAIQLSEVWFKITRYAWRRGKPSSLPPWSSQSDGATILAQQMEFETRMPWMHRFKPANFSQRSLEELNAHRDYWGPWLFIQFLYHTNLCLLNHPLLLSLRLRNSKCVIPEIFLQHTSDLISSHTSWIINFIEMLEAKGFKVTDPFLGHCVAIIATIYLQGSVVDDPGTRKEKQDNFAKCLRFIRGLAVQWPHVGRIADKLQGLSETVSSTHVASDLPTRQNRKLLIDLGQFFEVLEYASSSEVVDSARRLFGPSLHLNFPAFRTEMAQTSVLPEPTRVERQEFGNLTPAAAIGETSKVQMDLEDMPDAAFMGPLVYSDDELAVLAESFFHQRQEVDGNWWNMDHLSGE